MLNDKINCLDLPKYEITLEYSCVINHMIPLKVVSILTIAHAALFGMIGTSLQVRLYSYVLHKKLWQGGLSYFLG